MDKMSGKEADMGKEYGAPRDWYVLVISQASCRDIFTAAGLFTVEATWTKAFSEAFCDLGKLNIANRLRVDVRHYCHQEQITAFRNTRVG